MSQGEVVTLIGRDGTEQITAEQLAASAGTITNELLSRLGSRLERIVVHSSRTMSFRESQEGSSRIPVNNRGNVGG